MVTEPSLCTARKLSTWSRATGFGFEAVWARAWGVRLNDTTSAPVPIKNSRRVVSSIAMSGPLSHQGRGALHRGNDALVRPAAAQVVLERLADVAIGRALLAAREEGGGLHDHPVDAVAALGGLLLDESLLDGVGLLGRPQASSVTILPLIWATGATQERTGRPSTRTVQDPHCARPQPNFGPWSPRLSRRT